MDPESTRKRHTVCLDRSVVKCNSEALIKIQRISFVNSTPGDDPRMTKKTIACVVQTQEKTNPIDQRGEQQAKERNTVL